ncbi:MAG: hypothetical protein N839_0016505 [Desulfofustis sp. PB-SRB1]|nr:hypothetical protein [Desulfofustis sp. PB-SRB1]MBM1003997.1 hypothetical protein [Desulfofustis sp. PB-SRB1]HBH32764.1 hypothetical protein [Desulfofustis sp.]
MDNQAKIEAVDYLEAEGVSKLIADYIDTASDQDAFDTVRGGRITPFDPEPVDLARLHKMIRARKCFTVLEFGVGFSTIVMADALKKNKEEWAQLEKKPDIRNRFMFDLFSVDASAHWIERSRRRFPTNLIDYVTFLRSSVHIGRFNGQICHYYDTLPDIVPDFIYLDGPNPKDVQGEINGLSFQCDERTVMAADILLMESTLLPGTCIVIDGRTNNARFLERNLSRNYSVSWDPEGDVTIMELQEKRLGPFNLLGCDFF